MYAALILKKLMEKYKGDKTKRIKVEGGRNWGKR